ncbi:hypothetical protein MN032_03710 [Agromyces atrinae]|uniref:ABC transporter ATP-binding protein n=1 Tax=Agromyces atrinae TaxID=592376 RepID=A0A852SF07_9MICO|nr:hypothetical protein [Agromyces atrinae]MCI2956791.1 hypothetical protein [Agromyces atrinae]NYD67854.1 hypothetical protein [Agromyces atrinae]
MSNDPGKKLPQPSRRDVLRPLELLGGSFIAAVFVGLITLMVTRDLVVSGIATGGVFIIVLVALAMFVLAFKPDDDELADLDAQNRPDDSSAH